MSKESTSTVTRYVTRGGSLWIVAEQGQVSLYPHSIRSAEDLELLIADLRDAAKEAGLEKA